MQYPQPPYNPYARPVQPLGAASIDSTGHKPSIRLFFLIVALVSGFLYFAGLVAFIVAVVLDDKDVSPIVFIAGWCSLMLGALLIYVKLGLALYWLHGAWKWLPADQRVGRDGKRFTPGDVFMLLIPYYHFYWMFPINLALCDAMERVRAQTRATQTVKRDTAMWAAICELIPFANFFVAPFMWASYMRAIDTMHEDIMSALPR